MYNPLLADRRMKNAVLPMVSSQLYSFESNEAIYEVPLHMDNIGNVYGSGFSTEYDEELGGGFAVSSQCQTTGPTSVATIERLGYPYPGEGYLTTTSNNYDSNIIIHHHQPFSLTNNLPSIPQYQQSKEYESTVNPRKRPIEINENIQGKLYVNNSVSKSSYLEECTTKKKRKASMEFKDHQWCNERIEEGRQVPKEKGLKMPNKRSQKLSDKITVLQKLVSPYGKTDTASVLEEASISIKFLQDQIKNLCYVTNTSYTGDQSQKIEKKQVDLHSKGLCLVPASFFSETEKGRPISSSYSSFNLL